MAIISTFPSGSGDGSGGGVTTEEMQQYVDAAVKKLDIDPKRFSLQATQGSGSIVLQLLIDGEQAALCNITIEGSRDVTGELSAEALYQNLGDVADLVVNSLSTSRRIPMYLAKDTGEDNYVSIHDKAIEFVTGTTQGDTVQAMNPYNQLLYWTEDISSASKDRNGWPLKEDGTRILCTTVKTDYPVMVYSYAEGVKRSISFTKIGDSEQYAPVDIFGVGDGTEHNMGKITKTETGFDFMYDTVSQKKIGIQIGTNGDYIDFVGIRKTTGMDFSSWDSGTFTEQLDGGTTVTYKVEFDGGGNPVRITDGDGHATTITWGAGI